jgi:ELWxxDGT repeat protein
MWCQRPPLSTDDSTGRELWKTNRTVEGTSIVGDIYPGVASSSPSELATTEKYLYFRAASPEQWCIEI